MPAKHRAAATSIANWAEEQGGIPLFTIEGTDSCPSQRKGLLSFPLAQNDNTARQQMCRRGA